MTPAEALYAALNAPLGLVLRAGDGQRLREERTRLLKSEGALRELSVLGPDGLAQIWLVRKDRLRELLQCEETKNA